MSVEEFGDGKLCLQLTLKWFRKIYIETEIKANVPNVNSWLTYKQDTGKTLREQAQFLVAVGDKEEGGKILSIYD